MGGGGSVEEGEVTGGGVIAGMVHGRHIHRRNGTGGLGQIFFSTFFFKVGSHLYFLIGDK